jgi:hypothetical protein
MDFKSLKLLIKNDESLKQLHSDYYNWIMYSLENNKHIIIENIDDNCTSISFKKLANLYNAHCPNVYNNDFNCNINFDMLETY